MCDNPQPVRPELGLRVLKSWSMMVTMAYMTLQEQLQTQHICVWFYEYGTSRVQIRIPLRWQQCFFSFTHFDHNLKDTILCVTVSEKVTRLLTSDKKISHVDWLSVQVKAKEIFQLKNGFKECRVLKVFQNKNYTSTKRADADTDRLHPALVKLTTNMVLAIGGSV